MALRSLVPSVDKMSEKARMNPRVTAKSVFEYFPSETKMYSHQEAVRYDCRRRYIIRRLAWMSITMFEGYQKGTKDIELGERNREDCGTV